MPGEPEPALDPVKTADRTTVDAVGQKITYSFLVTNTGNVTIDDVTVDEGDFTGVGDLTPVTCPDAASSLAPGAQVTCSATYTVVAGDLFVWAVGGA